MTSLAQQHVNAVRIGRSLELSRYIVTLEIVLRRPNDPRDTSKRIF